MHTLGAPKDTLLKDTINVLGSQTRQVHMQNIFIVYVLTNLDIPLLVSCGQQGRQGLCQLHLVTTGTGPQPRRHGAQ